MVLWRVCIPHYTNEEILGGHQRKDWYEDTRNVPAGGTTQDAAFTTSLGDFCTYHILLQLSLGLLWTTPLTEKPAASTWWLCLAHLTLSCSQTSCKQFVNNRLFGEVSHGYSCTCLTTFCFSLHSGAPPSLGL